MYVGFKSLMYFLFIHFCLQACYALRDVKIKVPQAVVKGKHAELLCTFDLEGEKLYSVKWYRDVNEFFRYTPYDPEPVKVFKFANIKVKTSDSSASRIVLENVSREMSGRYSCEVTTEQPSFYTGMQTAELQVVEIPKADPFITGVNTAYSLNDGFFQGQCTSQYSFPPANITWYINDHIVGKPLINKKIIQYQHYYTVVSTIRHRIVKKIFPEGKMKLVCASSIYDVYFRSIELTVDLVNKRLRSDYFDWPPTTKAPPMDDLSFTNDYENSLEAPQINVWLGSPSTATTTTKPETLFGIASIFIVSNMFR